MSTAGYKATAVSRQFKGAPQRYWFGRIIHPNGVKTECRHPHDTRGAAEHEAAVRLSKFFEPLDWKDGVNHLGPRHDGP